MTSNAKNLNERTGQRLHGGILIDQAMAIRSIAMVDLPQLKAEGLVSDADITNLDALVKDIHAQLEERTRAKTSANLHSTHRADMVDALKAGRRRLNYCMESIFRGKPELDEYRQDAYFGQNIGRLCADVSRRLAFAKQFVDLLEPIGAGKAFQEKLETTVQTLENYSGQWEAAFAALPECTRKYNESKGRLYHLLRRISRAGQSLHAKDPLAANKYALAIISRGNKARAAATTDQKGPSQSPVVEIAQTKAA